MKNSALPPGLTLIENFITKEQEESLLKMLNWDEYGKMLSIHRNNVSRLLKRNMKCIAESASLQLKHRQVKHFGYEFEYSTNTVNPDRPIAPIPRNYKFLQTLFDKHGHKYTYDQLTINKYLPGQGSAFQHLYFYQSISLCSPRFSNTQRKKFFI